MRLWVDFNDVDVDDQVDAWLDQAYQFMVDEVVVGTVADLTDGEYQCRGSIVAIKDRWVTLQIDWSTWDSPSQRNFTSVSPPATP